MLVVDADDGTLGTRVDEDLSLHFVMKLWREKGHELLEFGLAVKARRRLLQIVTHLLLNVVWDIQISHRGIRCVNLLLHDLQLPGEGLRDDGQVAHYVGVDDRGDEQEDGTHDVGEVVVRQDIVARRPEHGVVESYNVLVRINCGVDVHILPVVARLVRPPDPIALHIQEEDAA